MQILLRETYSGRFLQRVAQKLREGCRIIPGTMTEIGDEFVVGLELPEVEAAPQAPKVEPLKVDPAGWCRLAAGRGQYATG